MENEGKVKKEDLDDLTIKCSWSEITNEVKDAFSFSYFEKDSVDDFSACETILPELCVFLSKPDVEQPLTIDLVSTDKKISLRRIHIISEANFIEVYGLFGEYLKTIIAELIEEVDGTLAFSCKIDDIKLTQVTLKFVGLKGASEVWFFGGKIWFERNENKPNFSKLNMELIDSRLSQGNCKLSPSADSLKKLVSEYMSRNGSQTQGCFESITQSLRKKDQNPALQIPSTSKQPVEFLQSYVDSSMKHMERKILDNVTEQIEQLEIRQNQRLDQIIKLLETNTAVKSKNDQ